MLSIGRLGGERGRKGDGHPGAQVLWQGLAKLDTITEVWRRTPLTSNLWVRLREGRRTPGRCRVDCDKAFEHTDGAVRSMDIFLGEW